MGWICAIPLMASLFAACGPGEPLAVGYVEGEYVLLAPLDIAEIKDIEVRKGDRLASGATVAVLESEDARIAVGEAEAYWHQAAAQLDNLRKGKRPEEIDVIEASLRSAKAEAQEAARSLRRQQELSSQGFASRANYDAAETRLALAEAKVAELEAQLAVARLPARAAEIAAAESAVRRAAASLEAARWRLARRVVTAPADGKVADVILRRGELAGPSSPVVSFLPDGATRLKLYVPQASLSAVDVGTGLAVRCDGCGEGLSATVSYVATEPEFTPPVIYSINNRQKLVYLVEARPNPDAAALKPGQIVDVVLARPDASR
ncbi:MAG: HlyD family efflux transporter periplasmic adaptor subunit [Pseudomonadota bacterium]|nr:HlyD family efflux transporter periplasmic adaptor subunit [Pseudomonadota bacterium]